MGNKYNLSEYAFAKEVVATFPTIEKELDKTYKNLYKYKDFLCVTHVLDSIADSKEMISRQYKYYKKVLEVKGKE